MRKIGTSFGATEPFSATASIAWSPTSELITSQECTSFAAKISSLGILAVCKSAFQTTTTFSLKPGSSLQNGPIFANSSKHCLRTSVKLLLLNRKPHVKEEAFFWQGALMTWTPMITLWYKGTSTGPFSSTNSNLTLEYTFLFVE